MKKQSVAIILISTFILTLLIGYALFSQSVTISGTATASATMDMEFTTATISSEVGSVSTSAVISQDGNTLTITVPQLQYPGSYANIQVIVTNVGTVPVKLTGVTENGLTTDNNIKISYTGLQDYVTNQTVISPNGTHTFNVKVEWDENSTQASQNINFSILLNYEQAV